MLPRILIWHAEFQTTARIGLPGAILRGHAGSDIIMDMDNQKKFPMGVVYAAAGLLVLVGLFWAVIPLVKNTDLEPTGQTMPVLGKAGDVNVRNVYKNPVEKTEEAIVISQKPGFKIIYFPKDEAFLITLAQTPISQSRALAEAELLANLGITKDQACELKVVITVPYEVDPAASGQNYPLSFCPN